jgi:hypothetical protein
LDLIHEEDGNRRVDELVVLDKVGGYRRNGEELKGELLDRCFRLLVSQ